MSGAAAVQVLEAWEAATPASAPSKAAIAALLARARSLVEDDMVHAIHARALMNGHRAVKTAWTDAPCPARFCAAPAAIGDFSCCLLYTSPSPRDLSTSRMPSSA